MIERSHGRNDPTARRSVERADRQGRHRQRQAGVSGLQAAAIAGPRWERLAAKGAKPQRLLWASTGTKNPKYYSDVLYVEELIGPDTVNTVPRRPSTRSASMARRGRASRTRAETDHARCGSGPRVDPASRSRDGASAGGRRRQAVHRRRRQALWRGREEARGSNTGGSTRSSSRSAKAPPRPWRRAPADWRAAATVRRLWRRRIGVDRCRRDKWLGWLNGPEAAEVADYEDRPTR